MAIASLHRSSALPTKPPGKPGHLITRREIGEEQRAERVNDRGKREQHRTVVESKTVAAAIDDPAPKRANQGPHNERRKGGKDSFGRRDASRTCLKAASLARRFEDFANIRCCGYGPGLEPGRRRLMQSLPPRTQSAATAAFCSGELPITQPLLDALLNAGHSVPALRLANDCPPNGPAAPERTECRILRCSKIRKMAPAKGAMAFRSASLYWCGWHTRCGAGGSLAPKKMRGRKHA